MILGLERLRKSLGTMVMIMDPKITNMSLITSTITKTST
jgi:hypothetical protein